MSEKRKLGVEELKNITGGAYVESGYIYYKLNGQNKRRQILALEDDVNYIVEKVMEAGASDEEIMEFFSHLCAPFGPEEDC